MKVERLLDKVISALLFGGFVFMMAGSTALMNKAPDVTEQALWVAKTSAFGGMGMILLGILMIPLYLVVPRGAKLTLPRIRVEW